MNQTKAPPQQSLLIGSDGQPHWGLFPSPPARINYEAFDLRNPMDRPVGRLARHFGLKHFQFLGVTGPQLVLGCALVDLRYVANAFLYLYDALADRLEEHSFLLPLARGMSWVNTPNAGDARFCSGKVHFQMSAAGPSRRLQVSIPARSRKGAPIELDLTFREPDGFETLALCTRTGYNGWTYTQKACGLLVTGPIQWGDRHFDLESLSVKGCSDWSCGYMRRETNWNWASFSGHSSEGLPLGFNLAAGVNETGFTENVFWHNGKLEKLDTIHFEYSRQKPLEPWRIRSFDGKLDLRFVPRGLRRERLNFVVLASHFRQLFGHFEGELHTTTQSFAIQSQMGFTEDHFARW